MIKHEPVPIFEVKAYTGIHSIASKAGKLECYCDLEKLSCSKAFFHSKRLVRTDNIVLFFEDFSTFILGYILAKAESYIEIAHFFRKVFGETLIDIEEFAYNKCNKENERLL